MIERRSRNSPPSLPNNKVKLQLSVPVHTLATVLPVQLLYSRLTIAITGAEPCPTLTHWSPRHRARIRPPPNGLASYPLPPSELSAANAQPAMPCLRPTHYKCHLSRGLSRNPISPSLLLYSPCADTHHRQVPRRSEDDLHNYFRRQDFFRRRQSRGRSGPCVRGCCLQYAWRRYVRRRTNPS